MTVSEIAVPIEDNKNFYDLSLEEQAKCFERTYWKCTSDYFHDIIHDGGDYYKVRKMEKQAWSELADMTEYFYKKYYESGKLDELKNIKFGNLIIERLNLFHNETVERQERLEKQEKRKEAKFAELCVKALEQVQTSELKNLLNDDGSLKERKSWGTIKNYLFTDEGVLLKKLWKLQFAS